jgi:hypothetical protein
MSVPDVVKEVDLLLLGEQCRTDGMNRRIAPSLIVEATGVVKVLEEVHVRLGAPEVETACKGYKYGNSTKMV